MGINPDADATEAPPPPGINKVEITVAGHTVVVESSDSLEDVAGYALGLFDVTAEAARRIPIGFDVTGGQADLAGPHAEPGGLAGEEDERHAG